VAAPHCKEGYFSLHLKGSRNIKHEVNRGAEIREVMATVGTLLWDDLYRPNTAKVALPRQH
jgi:hypothetical protein